MKAGRMRYRLSFYRKSPAKGGMGQAKPQDDQLLCETRAEMKYGTASEKVVSGAEVSVAAVTFRVRHQNKLADLSAADWFVDRSGVRYNIVSVVPFWSVREIEVHAERT